MFLCFLGSLLLIFSAFRIKGLIGTLVRFLCKEQHVSFLAHLYECTGFVVVVAFLFYVHGKHLRSCREGQLN